MDRADTIAALATPFGAGAVAVIRVSGPSAIGIADRIFRGARPLAGRQAGRVGLGRVECGGRVLDHALVTVFRAPHSYTGEDVVEFSGHGGPVVARSVLRALLESGARPAEPGEFTRRAFLNGKMDLTQAEAVMDLISARSEASARAAAVQLEGRLGREIEGLRSGILEALAHLEAFIDFPEEGIAPEAGEALQARVGDLRARTDRLLATADGGRMLREGVRLVIHGPPNAGKSSLLNLLVGYDRAMVSEIPGTTRDTIEENLTLRGIPFRVVDTAGLRESADPLEIEGMRRARRQLGAADIALRVIEAAGWPADAAGAGDALVVVNKTDLRPGLQLPDGVLPLCCLDGSGLEALVDAVTSRVDTLALGRLGEVVAINARHQECLTAVRGALDRTLGSLARGDAPELTAVELRDALAAVGAITGAADTDEVLDRIFATFCIGK